MPISDLPLSRPDHVKQRIRSFCAIAFLVPYPKEGASRERDRRHVQHACLDSRPDHQCRQNGNSICGNSAIAAVAPVIGADSDDVAASIAFTAVLGVGVVLGLPLLGLALGMSGIAFGAFAGLTVYAVPQVIAATSPLGATAVQMGTLVKLVRVLMLGPVCLVLSLVAPRLALQSVPKGEFVADTPTARRMEFAHLVPWFIVGFLALVVCRSLGLVPIAAIAPIGRIATLLTVVSMAGLGLGVDIRTVARAGGRVTAAVVLSLLALAAIGLTLLAALHIA